MKAVRFYVASGNLNSVLDSTDQTRNYLELSEILRPELSQLGIARALPSSTYKTTALNNTPKEVVTVTPRRTEQREDAGAAVSNKQMRPVLTPYPVDRYLAESRKQVEMVNIIDDDIWKPDPAVRPEDEIVLRKLHDMLQTTAEDLKLLSGELSKYHEPGVQVKTLPVPLDEEFNERVHIEEVVSAKFFGNKIVDKTPRSPAISQKETVGNTLRAINNIINRNNTINNGGQTSDLSMLKKQPIKKKLQISRTNTMEIREKSVDDKHTEKHVNIVQENKRDVCPAVAYSEVSHKYIQPNIKKTPQKKLQIQEMPSINIRSELRLQNVLQLDILPEGKETHTQKPVQQNALVIEMKHETPFKRENTKPIKFDDNQYIPIAAINKPPSRKVSTMTPYESSESNNISSDSQSRLQRQVHNISSTFKSTHKHKVLQNTQKNNTVNKITNRPQAYLEEWKRKLNTVYGRPSNFNNSDVKKKKISYKTGSKKPAITVKIKEKQVHNQPKPGLNNTEYIPYSKLTLGGVNVSDVEREISNLPNKNNIALSPILDKILSSRENSFHNDSPRKTSQIKTPIILTTSDENLLEEVLDIEMKVTKTLNINKNNHNIEDKIENTKNDTTKDDSYADDFEDEKSDVSEHSKQSKSETSQSSHNLPSDYSHQNEGNRPTEEKNKISEENKSDSNLTFTKVPNLSFKNKVDIFEYVHSVDTQETGTQSNTTNKITPKETQTSPKGDKANVQPIHNDLWPSIDPRGEVEKMLKLEKEFIKKLIIEEYGDLLEKSLNKPSTSGKTENENIERNVAASQKITQTSPAHVKSVMTSPTRTKTRTTSPFSLSVTVFQQTSPIVAISKDEELKIELENDNDLGISANLSSPRFSLRLPKSSRDVLSNLGTEVQNNKQRAKYDKLRKNVFSSTSSADGDYSSSDISSLGEINKKFKRLRKSRIISISEVSSSSSLSKYSSDPSGAILPLRSEGEASLGQMNRKKKNKQSKSDGEVSLGQNGQ